MANERRSHKIVLFCCKAHRKWLVDRRSSGKFIVKTGLIKATPSTLASEGKPDQSELSTNHSSSGLHWDCRRPSLIRWPKSQAFFNNPASWKKSNKHRNKQTNKQTNKKTTKKEIMIAIMNPHSAVGVSCRRNACYRSLFCILITASSKILPKCDIAVNSNCSNVAEVYCNTKMSLLWLIKRLKQKSGIQQSHDWSFTWSIILLPFTLTF